MNLFRIILFAAVTVVSSMPAEHANAGDTASNLVAPCAGPKFRQFDYFAGDWDTFDIGALNKSIARNKVDIILEGCVVHEDYRQNDGHHGESYSIYDAPHGVWHQTWVTNRGELLLLNGGMQGDRMVLTGNQMTKEGKQSLLRGAWYQQGNGVRETATRSIDGGKTWQPVFDIVFKPHR